MAKRVSSESQQEYKKEIRRIQRIISKGEKEGYLFPEDVVPKLPKRVTKKALEEIKAIKPQDLYKTAEFVGKQRTTIPEPIKQRVPKKQVTRTPKGKRAPTSKVELNVPKVAKPKPAPLTPEERAKRRSQAGKKAWETRKARMTPEEYGTYVKAQVERMQRGKKAKQAGEEYYPTKSAIEEVTHKIVDLERGFTNLSDEEVSKIESLFEDNYYPTIDHYDETFKTLHRAIPNTIHTGGDVWRSDKQALLSIWNNTLERNKNNLMDLENYLIDNMQEIEQHLFIIRFASKQEQFHPAFGALGTLLNQGAMSAIEAEEMHNMSEFYSYDENEYMAE